MPSGEAGDSAEQDTADDPWDELARANTAPESLERNGRRTSLAVALLHCELRLGSAFAYAPERWQTSDGGPPVRIVWAYFGALSMARALDAIDTARGIGIALGGDKTLRSPVDQAIDDAFPSMRE